MDWNLSGGRPVWLQLKERIAMGIVQGTYPPGSRLPSVRELAMDAGVNPNTMQRALTELERDGLATAIGTTGRVVTCDMTKIEGLRKDIARNVVEQFFSGMKQLGYSAEEAVKVLEEWGHE